MLVLRGGRDGIPGTELKILDWLSTPDLAGVVISGAHVRSARRRHHGRRRSDSVEADLIVITPQVCVVIEVKGIKEPVSGVLSCPVNGRWTMPGVDEPVNVRAGDVNPLDQAREAMYGFKNLLDETSPGPGTFVLALVVVMPIPGHTVTSHPGVVPMPPGCQVLVASRRAAVHRWFAPPPRRGAERPFHRACAHQPGAPWTAERVMRVLDALMVTHGVTIDHLIGHGFLAENPGTAAPTPQPAAPRAAVEPPASAPHSSPSPEPVATSYRSRVAPTTGPDSTDTAAAPHPAAAVRPPRGAVEPEPGASTRRVRSLVLAAAALIAVGAGLWGFAGCAGSSGSRPGDPVPTGTSIAPTPADPAPAQPVPSPSAEEPPPQPPPPGPPASCFPFQPDCVRHEAPIHPWEGR